MRRTLMTLLGIVVLMTTATSFAGDCSDTNHSGNLNILDAAYIISYLYKGGPEPNCESLLTGICGDVDNSGILNILDASYIIDYLYQGGPEPECWPATGTVSDIDGNIYRTIKIGGQWWMAENLKVTHYRNGDAIPNVTDNAAWQNLTTGAYCEYGNDIANVAAYGRLYNWFAVNDNRAIAPAGWHVASEVEWNTLIYHLGDRGVAGGKMKETGTTHWISPNAGATNESGFSGLPDGGRGYGRDYEYIGLYAYFWSSTQLGSYGAWNSWLDYNGSEILLFVCNWGNGFSVRCIKD